MSCVIHERIRSAIRTFIQYTWASVLIVTNVTPQIFESIDGPLGYVSFPPPEGVATYWAVKYVFAVAPGAV